MIVFTLLSVSGSIPRRFSGMHRAPTVLMIAAVITAAAIDLKAATVNEATYPAAGTAVPTSQPAAASEPIRVAGRVVDAQGQSAADVLVETRTGDRKSVSVRTDREGKFTLRAATMIEGWLKASTRDGTQRTLDILPDFVVNGRVPDVQLQLKPACKVTVMVKDGKGLAVADARTIARVGSIALDEVTTNAGGIAMLHVPVDVPLTEVMAMKPGVGLDYTVVQEKEPLRPDTQPSEAHHVGRIELVLNGVVPMTVRVLDEQRQPLAGAEVIATTLQKSGKKSPLSLLFLDDFRCATDSKGVAQFSLIPSDNTGTIHFQTRLRGYSAPRRCSIDPTSGNAEAETIMLRQVSLAGRVIDNEGRPANTAEVLIEGHGAGIPSFHEKTRTTTDGRFMIDVDPEMAYLLMATKDRSASPGVLLVVYRRAPADPVELVLGPATRLHGHVMAGNEPSITPGQYVRITLRDESYSRRPSDQQLSGGTGNPSIRPSITRWAEVDKDGRFELFVGPGRYGVFAPNARNGKTLTVSNQKEIELDLELPTTQPAQVLKGQVVLRNKPEVVVPNASIVGLEPNVRRNSDELRVTSDQQGRFTLGHNQGEIYIHATAEEGKLQGIVLVDDEQEDVIVPVGLTASARGRVVNAQGQPVARQLVLYGVRIKLRSSSPGRSRGMSTNWAGGQVKTNEKGEFRIEGLVTGIEYELSVMVDAPDGHGRLVPTIGTVTPDRAEQVDLGDLKLSFPDDAAQDDSTD